MGMEDGYVMNGDGYACLKYRLILQLLIFFPHQIVIQADSGSEYVEMDTVFGVLSFR